MKSFMLFDNQLFALSEIFWTSFPVSEQLYIVIFFFFYSLKLNFNSNVYCPGRLCWFFTFPPVPIHSAHLLRAHHTLYFFL